ncbi:MAG: imidazole glycerol phosphate synthase subunit HisH [Bacillota bacterium]
MILVYDYGIGNLRSICSALERAGGRVWAGSGPRALREADKVVFPGVGSFGAAMKALSDPAVMQALLECRERYVRFLGICLGMQIMFDSSEESPGAAGLGWFSGMALRLRAGTVPHMGWSRVYPAGETPIVNSPTYFYFAHSYCLMDATGVPTAGVCEHGTRFVAAIRLRDIWGVQFHPEKSGRAGARILEEFVRC